MRQFKTSAFVLRRVNYGEADRIITFLTSSHGKVGAMAKGVRRPKSKLAGGLEPMSEITITFGSGKGDLEIVLATRLETFYRNIIGDYERLQFAYQAIKLIDRSTEDVVDESFYQLLKACFVYLNNLDLALPAIEIWFRMQLEALLGRMPDLQHDIRGENLQEGSTYEYDVMQRGLAKAQSGSLYGDHIKFMRLAQKHSPAVLQQVEGSEKLYQACLNMLRHLD